MHAVVCLKQIVDPDIPPHLFAIDPLEKKQIRGSQSLVISAFDEIALEVALQLKEKTAGTVTAITIAGPDGVHVLRLALAMGADRVVLLSDPAFAEVSAFGKARILAAALETLGSFDLVLCGRQAGDVEMGLVGPFLAEALQLPCVTLVANAEMRDGCLCLKRPVEGGHEILEAPLPLLITVTNDESNVPRLPSVLAFRNARRQEIPVWSAADLHLDPAAIDPQSGRMQIAELFIPQRHNQCQLIAGESGAGKAQSLARHLRQLRLI
ncbi:MAG TPA: electron transfer flavoprotein subunit beta/FixA family protein [Anaerolineae bacterium]